MFTMSVKSYSVLNIFNITNICRFPWESAFSGNEVTPPDTCDGCRDRQIHVSAAVSWAIRQYYSATRDRDIHTNPDYNSCDMTREIAKFYAERAVYNDSEARYDLRGLTLNTVFASAL